MNQELIKGERAVVCRDGAGDGGWEEGLMEMTGGGVGLTEERAVGLKFRKTVTGLLNFCEGPLSAG